MLKFWNYLSVLAENKERFLAKTAVAPLAGAWIEILVDGATERNSVGCIFALKANYGYTETPQRLEIVNGQTPDQVAADIAARHIGQAKRPELPGILSDNSE